MPSKSPESSAFTVKKLVLEFEADATSIVTLRVKRDRRQSQLNLPTALERRGEQRQGAYVRKPASK